MQKSYFFFLISLSLFIQISLQSQTPFGNVPIENVGPTVQSGRVVDIAVNPEDPTHFYVAYASGGLWYTENNGTSFTPLFDFEKVMTIGDIDVNWATGDIWIGTGEANSSRSSYAGNGVYLSEDSGKTWKHLGLDESHHIGRIVSDPQNPEKVIVAVLGHLYTTNVERGIYVSMDKGITWERTLFLSENTGAVDLVMDKNNPDLMFCSMWQRERKAWNFTEAGPESGIYKSKDGGLNWVHVSNSESGFPTGEGLGRIGLDITSNKDTTRIYAFLDNYNRRDASELKNKNSKALTTEDLKEMSKSEFSNLSNSTLEAYLKTNGFPRKYTIESIRQKVNNDEIQIEDLALYVEDANRLLFDTPVIGAQIYYSDNLGETWKKTHEGYLDNVVYSYGYYFGQIRAYPNDLNKVVIMGVPILLSEDAGATWNNINGQNVHVDHHALWINPERDGHMINGNDGGINITYDHGKHWVKCNSPSVGQFYYINVDNDEPYNIYGGLQDNGVWKGSHKYTEGVRWHSTGEYPYESIMGGDGMQIQIDSRASNIVYTGYQFGNYFRIDLNTGKRRYITPKHELGDRPYRWNWQSPILISSHNEDIIYLGSNKLLRSFDKGNSFKEISEDLTGGGKKGDVPFGTLTTLDESQLQFGLLYTGSDDGKVHITKDGGNTWNDISNGLPDSLWISRIQASKHVKERVYITLNGYRNDDFNSYKFVSNDYGETWNALDKDFQQGPVNVIKEDPKFSNILYLGTDHGCFISVNQGVSFKRYASTLPHVPVHDVVIQNKARDLLIGTHGRSIYRCDITYLDQIDQAFDEKLWVFKIPEIEHSKRWGSNSNPFWPNPKHDIPLLIYSEQSQDALLSIKNKKGKELYVQSLKLQKGIQEVYYDLSIDQNKLKHLKIPDLTAADNGISYLPSGRYSLQLKTKANVIAKQELVIINK